MPDVEPGAEGDPQHASEGAAKRPSQHVSFEVSTEARPKFDHALVAYAFDRRGTLLDSADVQGSKVTLALSEAQAASARVFLAPPTKELAREDLTPARLERLGAYEPVLRPGGGGGLVERVVVPGNLLDIWPLCLCWVRGRVVRSSDGRPVCDAIVHVCEVDRVPWWILRLPEADVLRLRDDLIEVLRNPPLPDPPGPGPIDPDPPLFRTTGTGLRAPGEAVGFNPQPEPPARRMAEGRGLVSGASSPSARLGAGSGGEHRRMEMEGGTPSLRALSSETRAALASASAPIVRAALAENWRLVVPWFCIWPWWWWRFRCDEIAVRTTDAHGRFEAVVAYACGGDHPDLYFWVEFDLGGGPETVYRPHMACNTYWNYACGSDVTLYVADSRVPACAGEGDLPGCQVVVNSLGRNIAVREVRTDGAGPTQEGLTSTGQPFGATIEPRVDFSRTCLIDQKGIPYYRWSYRRLSGPDGMPDAGMPSGWTPLARSVYRHYKVGTSYPSEPMGPLPTSGSNPAPDENLFRIRPLTPPAGTEWIVLNEHIDLATAYFETASLSGAPPAGATPSPGSPVADDLAAGRYELKLELFDGGGNLVNWTAAGIDLRITEQNAPFGTGTITTDPAPDYNRVLDGSGDTLGFRMVLRVDNNRCYAEVMPVAGDVPPDPDCGFHEYASASDQALLAFVARHPNGFATYGFSTRRAAGASVGAASCSGVTGEPGTNGFTLAGAFAYQKNVGVGTLLGVGTMPVPCEQAAFSERVNVEPMATNGYGSLTGYRHSDVAAFALAKPCACDDGPGRGGSPPGQGQGHGQG